MRSDVTFINQPTRFRAVTLLLTLASGAIVCAPFASHAQGRSLNSAGGRIQHVVDVQFGNVHITRDNWNVPSDLEQMRRV